MKLPKSTEGLGKYLLTGAISFIASLVYTEYRLEPRHNVNLVPLSIKVENSDLACAVDENKLTDSIKNINTSEAVSSLPQSDTYESYLLTLFSQALVSKLVLRDFIPSKFLPRLENENILICNQQVPAGATFTLEAATLFEQPTPYLLRRSCSMLYQGVEIPIRVSIDAKSTNHRVTEPETVPIRETGNLFFFYDQRRADKKKQDKFGELLQKVSKESIDLSIKCLVISPYKDIEIGGHRPYTVSAPPTS